LLDEPTNHLDIAAIEWLEACLHDWDGAVLLISHDRYFLDQVVTAIWEMTPVMELYRGNYSAYIQQRAERYQHRLEEYQSQLEFVDKEEEYIRRNIAGQNTRQAQGRRKRLERMLDEARLTPPHDSRRLHINLQPVMRSGDLVLRTTGLQVGYANEGRPLFFAPDLTLVRGECAAILGPNGAGKTTFLKTLLDQVPPYLGELTLGASLKIGYFAQAHEGLHSQLTLMQEIQGIAPNLRPAETRDYLAKFLFTGDDVFKEVSVLSGGERGRLALACLALQGANLLLLDEPTNHLDLPAQEVLQAILADYKGTILLVSHDRYLIDALATQIWEVIPAESALRVFSGTYSEYKEFKTAQAATAILPGARPKAEISRPRQSSGPSKMELRKRQQRLEAVEGEIASMETQLAVITRQLENPGNDSLRIQRLGQDYSRLQQDLEKKMDEWTALSEQQK
jgi:ATP-binding cassette subfamily F protein 3